MGCSAAKNLTVEPLEGNAAAAAATAVTNGHAKAVSVSRKVSDVPPLEGEEPQAEMLDDAHINNIHKGANGLSFEIAFEDEDESIIKKHPPKRLQMRLEETLGSVPTLEKLQEKLEEAEERRQQILQQRVQSAKQRNALKKQSSVTSMTDENDESKKDPPDIPPATNNNAFEPN